MDLMQALSRRTVPYVILVAFVALLLLGCGPVAQPDPEPFSPSSPVSQEVEPTPTPTPTPTPQPTVCVTVPDNGGSRDICITPEPPKPTIAYRYDNLIGGLQDQAVEAEDNKDKPGGASQGSQLVAIIIDVEGGDDPADVIAWLKKNNVPYADNEPGDFGIVADVPLLLLGPLSRVEAVQYITEYEYIVD